jgi:hypothetical protein
MYIFRKGQAIFAAVLEELHGAHAFMLTQIHLPTSRSSRCVV